MGDHYPECEKGYNAEGTLPCICELLVEFGDRAERVERERLRAQVEEIVAYSTFGPDGSLDGADAVLRSDVLAIFKEKSE